MLNWGKKKRKEKKKVIPDLGVFDPKFFIARRLHPFIKGGFVLECSLLRFPFIIVLLEPFIFFGFLCVLELVIISLNIIFPVNSYFTYLCFFMDKDK